jgi:16S rRNA (adenine1518-N6/adenine1519-N6)-dimethyltransferase
VRLVRKDRGIDPQLRKLTFAIVDAAFGQRRKTLRTALRNVLGSPQEVEDLLRLANIDPGLRGEQLNLDQFVAIAQQAQKKTGYPLASPESTGYPLASPESTGYPVASPESTVI